MYISDDENNTGQWYFSMKSSAEKKIINPFYDNEDIS